MFDEDEDSQDQILQSKAEASKDMAMGGFISVNSSIEEDKIIFFDTNAEVIVNSIRPSSRNKALQMPKSNNEATVKNPDISYPFSPKIKAYHSFN